MFAFLIFSSGPIVTRCNDGSGIGLAIVRKATERMGGEVGMESEIGQESTVWLKLKKPVGTETL